MCKSTPTLSAQSVHGGTQGREVIDLASAPTPWHRRWDGGSGGREGRKERYITLLHLQPYSNLVSLSLLFLLVYQCLFLSPSLFNSLFHFSPPPPRPQCFFPLTLALIFPLRPYLSSLLLSFTVPPSLISSRLFGRNSGFIIQPHLCQDGSDTAVEPSSLGTSCRERERERKYS